MISRVERVSALVFVGSALGIIYRVGYGPWGFFLAMMLAAGIVYAIASLRSISRQRRRLERTRREALAFLAYLQEDERRDREEGL